MKEPTFLGKKMAHNKIQFLHASQDGFTITSYMHAHIISCISWCDRQLKTCSHQLEIEIGRYAHKSTKEQISKLCGWGGIGRTLFPVALFFHEKEGEVKRHRQKLLDNPRQSTITTFFVLMTLVNKWLHMQGVNQNISKGLYWSVQQQLIVHVGHIHLNHDLSPLSSTIEEQH